MPTSLSITAALAGRISVLHCVNKQPTLKLPGPVLPPALLSSCNLPARHKYPLRTGRTHTPYELTALYRRASMALDVKILFIGPLSHSIE
jgi:hypothetical protein